MYEIKVLSNDEFDKVALSDPRYSYVDETNLGFADREKGIAYVRQTGLHDLNKYLISHELEELEHDESTHEDTNGIRHKKFFKEFLRPLIGPILSLINPQLGAIVSAIPFFGKAATQGPSAAFSSLFGGGGGARESSVFNAPQQQSGGQSSGSYFPESGVFTTPGAYPSPLSLFSGSGSYTPGTVPSSAQGSIAPGVISGGDEEVPDYLKQQKFGTESGRILFR